MSDAESGATWGQTPEALAEILAHSRFRSSFYLTEKDREYVAKRGWEVIGEQARKILSIRLAPAHPRHDGRQTPWRGHVVFTAQHATGCCCRGCLEKIHRIPQGEALTEAQLEYAQKVILWWLQKAAGDLKEFEPETVQPELWDRYEV